MKLDTLEVPKAVATKKLDALRRELSRRRKPIDDEISRLEKAYEAAAEGTPVIQLGQAVIAGGFFDRGMPKIAVARSHADRVRCRKQSTTLTFWSLRLGGKEVGQTLSVELPKDLQWQGHEAGSTIVPLVPSEALETAGVRRNMLRHYVTLFEVERWEPVPPTDPALLKHIAGDLYAVLAVWDLTALERAVIAGTR
jgi:hypothetical protein